MSILVIPSQNQEKILTGVRARDADNNLYFISCEADLHAVNPRETGKTYCTLYITPDRHLIGDKSIDCFVSNMKTLKESDTEYNIRPIYAYRDSSRLSLSIVPLCGDFDSDIVGFAVCTHKSVLDAGYEDHDWESRAVDIIIDELAAYQEYLNGKAKYLTLYQYDSVTQKWVVVDSMGSCYGIERMSDIASVFFESDAVSTYSDPDEIIIAHESNL